MNCFRRTLRKKKDNIEAGNTDRIELGNLPSSPRPQRRAKIELSKAGSEEEVFVRENSVYFLANETQPKQVVSSKRRKSPRVNRRVEKLGIRASTDAGGYCIADAAIIGQSLQREQADRIERGGGRQHQPSWQNEQERANETYINNNKDFRPTEVSNILHMAL